MAADYRRNRKKDRFVLGGFRNGWIRLSKGPLLDALQMRRMDAFEP